LDDHLEAESGHRVEQRSQLRTRLAVSSAEMVAWPRFRFCPERSLGKAHAAAPAADGGADLFRDSGNLLRNAGAPVFVIAIYTLHIRYIYATL
jgi:hypothetical protein